MRDPKDLRDLARKCRERAKSTIDPAVTEQLRRWATELADAADDIERHADPTIADAPRDASAPDRRG